MTRRTRKTQDQPPAVTVALAVLRTRWAAGHTHGCCCHGRPGVGCAELRRIVLGAGGWMDLQEDACPA